MIASGITTLLLVIGGGLLCLYLFDLTENSYIQAVIIIAYGFMTIYKTTNFIMDMAINYI